MHNDAPQGKREQRWVWNVLRVFSSHSSLISFIDRVKDRKTHSHRMLIGVMFGTRILIKIKISYVSLLNFGISSIWRELVKGKHFYLEPCFLWWLVRLLEGWADSLLSWVFCLFVLFFNPLTKIICQPKEFPKLNFISLLRKPNYYISRFPLTFAAIHNEGGKSGLLWCRGKKGNISLLWKNISQSLMWKRISTSNKGPVDHRIGSNTKQYSKGEEKLYLSKSVCPGKQKLFNNCKSEITVYTPQYRPLNPQTASLSGVKSNFVLK